MTPEQAIQLLDQATASIATDRRSHEQLVTAIRVLTALLKAPIVSHGT